MSSYEDYILHLQSEAAMRQLDDIETGVLHANFQASELQAEINRLKETLRNYGSCPQRLGKRHEI